MAPIDVRVPGAGPDSGSASIGGVRIVAAPGEELQRTVLKHLHRIALTMGGPVLATVHDERIGYVVPLEVHPDGSSRYTAEPVPTPTSRRQPAAPASTPPRQPGAPVPTGVFGPPPVMDDAPPVQAVPATAAVPAAADLDPGPEPVPPSTFDAVAEALLGDAPETPRTAPIGDAVRAGRPEEAAALAERALSEASATYAPDHPEHLAVVELAAYVAYLAADPLRAFRLSVDAARARHRTGDEDSAYGNVQSAATAWRAVRDPALGLELGHELIALWTALAAGNGPAAADAEELDAARTRMGRLTRRAAAVRGAGGGGPRPVA
ncbi:hypothetical protein [Streptomyces sp. NPDC006610]|uniref:hypothetical protein n=1 Tax=Streptomyces sp. NPDC006610 TaxID=3154584 RepID=UPI0033AC0E75